ncbi:unnamed protein product [Closterium sp. NIES-54]
MNRTLQYTMHKLLRGMRLPNHQCPEAMDHAVMLHNFLSSSSLPNNASPHLLWTGKLGNTKMLRVFGCMDQGVDQFTPASQRVTHCTCARTGRHLATFTRRPGSSLYTLSTESPPVPPSGQVAASSQVLATTSGPGPASAPCSCRLLSHQTLLWHHRLGHPSLPRLRGMASRVLVSGLPRSLPPLPSGPTPTCIPCVKGRQRAAPHSSAFPPTEAPLQTLHMDVKDDVTEVLIDWIRAARLQLRESFGSDFPVLRLHSDRGGEFSSARLGAFCRAGGIRQTFTLPASPQQNGIAERRIGMVMDVARTSMIHAAAPHFLWPFAVQYAAHQLNLQPQVSVPETSPTLRWTGKVGNASGPAPSGVSQVDAVEPVEVAVDCGAGSAGAEPGGAGSGGAERGGAEPGGAESEGAEPGGAEPGSAEPGGAGSARVASRSASSRRELLSPQELREWFARRWSRAAGAGGPTVATGPGGARTRGTGAVGTGGAVVAAGVGPAGASGAAGAGAAGGAGAGVCPAGGTAAAAGGTGAAGPAGVGAAGASGATGAGAAGGVSGGGSPDAGPSAGTGVGAVGSGGAAGAGAATGGTGAVPGGSGDPARPRPYFVPLLEQPVSPLPAPSPYTGPTGGLAERREPASRPASPVRAARTSGRAPRQRPPVVPGTHQMALRPSTASQRVPLPSPPASSLPVLSDPASDSLRAASPTVARLLSTVVTDPSFESAAASALVTELVDFAACCRLDYAASLVAESASVCPPSVGGECALSTDVLEDRQEEFQCFAAALPHLVSMLIAPEGDPDAPDIPTPQSYAEAIEGPYSSQWQSAMDAEMASWKSTRTCVDEVPPPGANIVSGMWIFRVKRPLGSPPVFKACYVARGFSQRQGVDYFQTFSPTPKMTTLRVLLHVAAQRDYELHSLDFSTAFLQGSLHEEIWLRCPPGFTGSFPPGTQWSLWRPVYGLRQAPREWQDTLRTTLAALGFAPSTADPSLFLRTDTSLPPFYILVYVDDLVFATAGLAHVKSELQKRHTCTDLGELRSYLGLQITRDRAQRTITLTQLSRSSEPGGAVTWGPEPGGAAPGGAEPRGAEPEGGDPAGAPSPQRLREWYARRCGLRSGAPRFELHPAGGAGAVGGAAGAAGGTGATGGAPGAVRAAGGSGAGGGAAGAAGGTGATGGAPGAVRAAGGSGAAGGAAGATGGSGAVGGAAGAAGGTGATGGAPGAARAAGGSGATGAPGGAPGAEGVGAAAGGSGPVSAGSGGMSRPHPYFPTSPLPGPSPHTGPTGGLTELREPESRPVSPTSRSVSPVRAARPSRRVKHQRPPAVPGTHPMLLRLSTAPRRVSPPSPPASSLPALADPESDSVRAASPTIARLLSTVVTDPSFESAAASALVTELVDFAAHCRLDYAAGLVAESKSVCPPSVEGGCALGTDVLEDRQEEFECFAAAVPHLVSMLIAPEGDPDAPDIPTPRSYAEAIAGEYSSQWQSAMDAEMASWKSTRTCVDEVPPPRANIVSGMWIFRVKRPPGSPPVFKARYVARGFSQREGVDFFQTFSPTPKMTTLRVLLHVAAQRDYELHSLDFSTAFLQGSLHEEIWLRRPPGFTGSFPPGTQWSLRQPVYGLRQAPREWHDTLRTTLAALGFSSSTADPSLFLRTDPSLPPFYILVYVDDLVFATADTEALAHVKSELQKRHTCTDLGEVTSYLGLRITWDRARRTITLTQSHMVQQVLQRFGFTWSSAQATPLAIGHSLSALPSDESVEPSGPYPELVGCLMYLMTCTRPDLAYPLGLLARYVAPSRHRKVHWDAAKRVLRYLCSTLGMGLVLGGRRSIVLTGHSDASWVDDQATQRSSQGYTFSLGSGSVSWRSTRSSSVLSSSCEAEIYATAMAAQELRWLTYLLTDLGERPSSPPVLYVDNKAAIALCQEHRLEHRMKHIALRYFLARELQQRGQLCLRYVATRANTADIFPKALQPGDHQRFSTVLGLVPTVPHLLLYGDVVIHPELALPFLTGLAEIYAGAMAAQELRWLTYLLTDLGEEPRSPPILYVDNKASREHRLEHRTKHIALRYFLARELQQRGPLRLAYVASQANTADIFTKALPPGDHQRFCTMLGLVPTWPHLLTS